MMFEAIIFLSGAVLFFLSVLFFVFVWQDRVALLQRKAEMREQVAELEQQAFGLKEKRVDMEIMEHELRVWAEGLERQQLAIEQAQEELRMLTATKTPVTAAPLPVSASAPDQHGEVMVIKNVKRQRDGAKLPK
jgi:hypothetical protein